MNCFSCWEAVTTARLSKMYCVLMQSDDAPISAHLGDKSNVECKARVIWVLSLWDMCLWDVAYILPLLEAAL